MPIYLPAQRSTVRSAEVALALTLVLLDRLNTAIMHTMTIILSFSVEKGKLYLLRQRCRFKPNWRLSTVTAGCATSYFYC